MTLERPTLFVSTGELAPPERVRMLVDEAYKRFASVVEGMPSQVYRTVASRFLSRALGLDIFMSQTSTAQTQT